MTHRKDISLDPKATHYCGGCGLTMKAREELMCPVADGDFCLPKKREPKRPEGCRCPLTHANGRPVAKRDRCDEKWVRCQSRANLLLRRKVADAKRLLKVEAKREKR